MSNQFETRFEGEVAIKEDRLIEGYASVFNK